MIVSLELWNFKSVEYDLMRLSPGLTALRGLNERGKSTRFEAISYALYGARALNLSLAETVTWGKPESSLKVKLVFKHSGSEYEIRRSKAGAELSCKTQNLLASGQAEVTKYVEGLFGVNADTAGKLTVASQNALRGALEGRAAVPLIEKLANINLIDELIAKVQEQLPSGSTKALEATLEQCSRLPEPRADFSELERLLSEADAAYGLAASDAQEAKNSLFQLQIKFEELERTLPAAYAHNSKVAATDKEVISYLDRLSRPQLVFEDDIEDLERKVQKQSDLLEAKKAYIAFQNFKPTAVTPHSADLAELLAEANQSLVRLVAKRAELQSDLRVALIGRINEEQCTLCGKLLQDVPEVQVKNADVDSKVEELKAHLVSLDERIADITALVKDYTATSAEATRTRNLFASLQKYVTLDEQTPPNVVWKGEPPLSDTVDYKSLLQDARRRYTAVHIDQAQRDATQKALDTAHEWQKAHGALVDLRPVEEAKETLTVQRVAVLAATSTALQMEAAYKEIQKTLEIAKIQFSAQVSIYEAAKTQAAALQSSIRTYDANNALIKRLREVRPIVAAQLWAVVLAAVSRYFSEIRGTRSTVTVLRDGFLVDGKPAEAYSGSTLDSLGLAIRIALAKTFLPNLDFLLLDEPAAGMDDKREAAMLGVLAGANFAQVILVTHSDLADTFAQSVHVL